jgi:hypothetical protein
MKSNKYLGSQLRSRTSRSALKKSGNKSNARFDPYAAEYAWKWAPPKSGKGKTKTLKDKTFPWCVNHQHRDTKKRGMWVAISNHSVKSSHQLLRFKTKQPELTTLHMASFINAYEDNQE